MIRELISAEKSEAYPEPFQTFKVIFFLLKIVNGLKPSAISAKNPSQVQNCQQFSKMFMFQHNSE